MSDRTMLTSAVCPEFTLQKKIRGSGRLANRRSSCECGSCERCKSRAATARSRYRRQSTNPVRESNNYVRPSAEWLRQKYWAERLDCPAIAKLLGCDAKTLWQWIKDYGIETRKRGHANPHLQFKKGHKSAFTGKQLSPEARRTISEKAKARGTVPYLINGVHWMKVTGRKPANWKGGITPERQTFYRSPEWKAAFAEVWKRDKGICQCCGLDSKTVDKRKVRFPLHHIDGFKIVERRADPTNLILLCLPCHLWIHGTENIYGYLLGAGHESEAA